MPCISQAHDVFAGLNSALGNYDDDLRVMFLTNVQTDFQVHAKRLEISVVNSDEPGARIQCRIELLVDREPPPKAPFATLDQSLSSVSTGPHRGAPR